MRVYTVHLLSPGSDEGLVFVREGFSFFAFLLSWLWALRHRLWLFAGALIAADIAVAGLGYGLDLHPAGQATLNLAVNLAAGLFGNDVRRRTLAARGYRDMGVVSERDEDAAAKRFLDAHPLITDTLMRKAALA